MIDPMGLLAQLSGASHPESYWGKTASASDWLSYAKEYFTGAVDSMLAGAYYTPIKPEMGIMDTPASLSGVPYKSPFPAPQSSEAQLARDLGPTAGILFGLATRNLGGVAKGAEATLFRVVDNVELTSIKKTGAFSTAPGQFEGKQFVDNLGDAQKLQKVFADFFGGNQTIVKGQAPQSVLNNASRTPFSDIPNGTAITIQKSDLPLIKPKF
ncbi:MAG: hypothetical protein ACOH1Q_12605 [Thiobacillus sp.]